jgi:hypothetical protein
MKIPIFIFMVEDGGSMFLRHVGTYLQVHTTLQSTSALKMEAVCSSETLVFFYKSPWRYNPADQHPQKYTSFRDGIFMINSKIQFSRLLQNVAILEKLKMDFLKKLYTCRNK